MQISLEFYVEDRLNDGPMLGHSPDRAAWFFPAWRKQLYDDDPWICKKRKTDPSKVLLSTLNAFNTLLEIAPDKRIEQVLRYLVLLDIDAPGGALLTGALYGLLFGRGDVPDHWWAETVIDPVITPETPHKVMAIQTACITSCLHYFNAYRPFNKEVSSPCYPVKETSFLVEGGIGNHRISHMSIAPIFLAFCSANGAEAQDGLGICLGMITALKRDGKDVPDKSLDMIPPN